MIRFGMFSESRPSTASLRLAGAAAVADEDVDSEDDMRQKIRHSSEVLVRIQIVRLLCGTCFLTFIFIVVNHGDHTDQVIVLTFHDFHGHHVSGLQLSSAHDHV